MEPVGSGRVGKPHPAEVVFERILREHGSTHRLTGVRAPTTTGKVERFHKTLPKELLATLPPLPAPRSPSRSWSLGGGLQPASAAAGAGWATPSRAVPRYARLRPPRSGCGGCAAGVAASRLRPPGRRAAGSRAGRSPNATGRPGEPGTDQPNGAAAGGRHAGAGVGEPGGGRPAGLAGPAAGRPDGPGATGRGHHARQPGRPAAQDPAVPPATKGPGPRPAGGRPTGRASTGQRGRPRGAAGLR